MEDFLAWNLLGLIFGLLTFLSYMKWDIKEFFSTIFLGLLGSLLGGFVANLVFGGSVSLNLIAMFIAMLGSLSLLLIDATYTKK